jgi:hypothetical protein
MNTDTKCSEAYSQLLNGFALMFGVVGGDWDGGVDVGADPAYLR